MMLLISYDRHPPQSLHKILAKIIPGRLKKVLHKVILSRQPAFLPGRQIFNGVVVATEVVDLAKRKKDEYLLFKVDFKKAYDSVSWDYLMFMMERINFYRQWMTWIRTCICSSSMSPLVNGSEKTEFIAHMGLRQGDPLSSLLFLIATEGLSGMMERQLKWEAFGV